MLIIHFFLTNYKLQTKSKMCKHKICESLHKDNCNKGVGALIINKTNKKLLLGRERWGKWKDKLNLCAGSIEVKDDNCYLKTLIRELAEEFKLLFNWKAFDAAFKNKNKFSIFLHHNTPIFVGFCDFYIDKLNKINEYQFSNNFPTEYREMSELKLININSLPADVSRFALGVIRTYKNLPKIT